MRETPGISFESRDRKMRPTTPGFGPMKMFRLSVPLYEPRSGISAPIAAVTLRRQPAAPTAAWIWTKPVSVMTWAIVIVAKIDALT